jgi:protein-arginine deiminase
MSTAVLAAASAGALSSCGGDEDLGLGDPAGVGAAGTAGPGPAGSGTMSSGSGGGPAAVIIDLRADVNRDGVVDISDPTDDNNEDTWDNTHGAIFLANIDDDEESCPTSGTDSELAACNDAADSVINGPDDPVDLARLRTAPWALAPADATGKITVSQPGAAQVRLFKLAGGTFQLFDPAAETLAQADLINGVELAIEARDIVRDSAVWDGFVDITLDVHAGTGPDSQPLPDGSDTVRMRVAPVLTRHHLDPAVTIYATNVSNSSGSAAFRSDLKDAMSGAGLSNPLYEIPGTDQWTQDFFETMYMSMPGQNGAQHVIHVNFRSANYRTTGLRSAGKVVFTLLRGKDVAGAVQYDPNHSNTMDTLNSFGNLETIPPYSFNGKTYPVGRIYRGNVPSFFPDPSFLKMMESQGVQTPVYTDTSWLLVGHVDETASFLKASTPRGWVVALNDPAMARKMLEDAEAAGYGGTSMFAGTSWQTTISSVLSDPDVMNESAASAAEVDAQLAILKQETGITDQEVIHVPFLHESDSGYSVAYQPGTVNGIYLADKHFGAPEPKGPVINGEDIFKKQLNEAFAAYGITVHYIENWSLYHVNNGEVHCGSNTTRAIPANIYWWESGQ